MTDSDAAPDRPRRSRAWPYLRGPLVTAATCAGLVVLAAVGVILPNPGVPLLVAVMYAAYSGGLVAGMASALIAVAFIAYAYSGQLLGEIAGDPLLGMVVIAVAAPAVAVVGAAGRRRIESAAQGRVQGAQELSRTLLGAIRDGVLVSRAGDGVIRDVNPALVEMTGFSRDELLRSGPPYPFWPPEAGPTMRAALEETFAGTGGEDDQELITRDGRRLAVIVGRAPLRDGRGRIVGAVSTIKDVTERRTQEEALRRSQQQLEQAQRMEAVGRLAGGIAHDFNNLLTAITGYTDLILGDLRDESIRSDLIEIRRTAERASALTRQLLTFSRREVFQPKVIDLNRVIAGVEPMLHRLLGEEIQLVTLLDPRLRPIRADASQLEQVIVNLAVNARDAMPEGGLLSIETLDREIGRAEVPLAAGAAPAGASPAGTAPAGTVPASQPAADMASGPAARYAVLSVSDTGHGMGVEARTHLFEPFYTTKDKGKGTGLGLATVYGIITSSGATIEVESEPGRGTTFRILFPEADTEAAVPTPEPIAEVPLNGDETILVAEDDPAVRSLVSHVLRRLGYEVLEAAAPSQAELIAERHNGEIHMLLSDVVMPGTRGPELARRLRRLRPGIRVLFISGYTDDAVVSDGVLEGQGEFLEKPFTALALGRRVRQILDSAPVAAGGRERHLQGGR
jgi:PAS domain S-box-containing protein